VTYSFVEAAWEADFANNTDPIELANPIASQMSVMRSTLIGGLVDTLVTNRKRQTERVRIFELGRCFSKSDNTAKDDPSAQFSQPLRVAGLAAGLAAPEQWGSSSRRVDFYDVKADIEALFSPEELRFVPINHPALHPGRCAEIFLGEQSVGVLGELHPRWVQKYALGAAPIVFELMLVPLMVRPLIDYQEVSRLPTVFRDLALVVEQSQPAQGVLDALRLAAPVVVRDIVLFDVYQGKGLLESQKSLAFHIVMQDTQRTLEDVEIEEIVSKLVLAAQKDFGAVLR
ncbi:MAG TPA: phenylalanine--tRNA ligase subunit beta, partial [Rugosibacter sp.]|nr:phenylalanine--tRNA ligase subunit beta [Rugosibacter sp.]